MRRTHNTHAHRKVRNPRIFIHRRDVVNGADLGVRRKKLRQESNCSVDVDPKDLENRKEAERQAQSAQGISKNCRESVSPLSRLIRCFYDKYN